MTHRELAYQKICFIKHTDLFRLIFQNVGSTKNTFDSHGSGVKLHARPPRALAHGPACSLASGPACSPAYGLAMSSACTCVYALVHELDLSSQIRH